MDLKEMANAVRALSIDMIEKAGSGHPGMPLGAADIITVLFSKVLRHAPTDPLWPDRDRFILSSGHASSMLYAVLHLSGYKITLSDLQSFRQLGSTTSGHPEVNQSLGIECTTGPLGQGIGMGVGMAIAERMAHERVPEIVNHHTWVLAGDGCLMEGISHEACSLAGRLQLKNFILLFDSNSNTIDGSGDLSSIDDHISRFKSYGWVTMEADGHDPAAISQILNEARNQDQPVFIKFETTIGRFSPLQDTHAAHGTLLGPERTAQTRKALSMGEKAFALPPEVINMWHNAAEELAKKHNMWIQNNALSGPAVTSFFSRPNIKDDIKFEIDAYKSEIGSAEPIATRTASGEVLERLTAVCPHLVGGSADLSGPTCTFTTHSRSMNKDVLKSNYIHYGIREHAMGAIMNGIALHGPFIPYGGTFLAFADYMKPAIRLSAMMNQHVIYIMSHDSIAIGEDGPTHQPVEHLASYRALPNMLVLRPADRQETAEVWQIALTHLGPSMILLTRLATGDTRQTYRPENRSMNGGYLVQTSEKSPDLTIITSGSELAPSLSAARILISEKISCDVVSMPCLELFSQQTAEYRQATVRSKRVLIVEAASTPGWEKILTGDISFKAMDNFGASGKKDTLLEYYNYTDFHIAQTARKNSEAVE